MRRYKVHVGSYTSNGGKGISVYDMDGVTGALRLLKAHAGIINPSFLAMAPDRKRLYAVNEVAAYYGRPDGSVSAFSLGPDGDVGFINQRSTLGGSPCHVALDRSGRFVMVANYGGGSVSVFPLDAEGRIGPQSGHQQHQGSGPVAARQEGPHAHCIGTDLENRHALAADLGLDRIFVYGFDPETGALQPSGPHLELPAGSGPRHFAFHPRADILCVLHELKSILTVWRREGGGWRLAQTFSTLPAEVPTGENYPSGLAWDAAGKFLYLSNRGHDSLAWFGFDPATVTLTLRGHVPCCGRFPRHFALDPRGEFLLAANQKSDSVTTFRIDAESGRPVLVGDGLEVAAPACILITEWP